MGMLQVTNRSAEQNTTPQPSLLWVDKVSKTYPGVVANLDVSFDIAPGEIHALLGENGAGKSTLVKMIYGLLSPDQGYMSFRGQAYSPDSPRIARELGIGMVFQHFNLFNALSVAENIALGMDHPPPMRNLKRQISDISAKYALPIDPARLVGTLSAGEQQRVEIIRCLLQNPQLLIMDEPTSVLTPQEAQLLFKTLRNLSSAGTAILYISHKLTEIQHLCSRATILRRGEVVAHCDPRHISTKEMAELMVGQALPTLHKTKKIDTSFNAGERMLQAALEVNNLSLTPDTPFGTHLKSVSFSVMPYEILGIAGVAGNGQNELICALCGEYLSDKETIRILGRPIGNQGPQERRIAGLLSAPEDRLGHAIAPEMTLVENTLISASHQKNLVQNGMINWSCTRSFTHDIVEKFGVRTLEVDIAARALSGGNLQKFVIGREINQNPRVIVINQPTWGVDAAAATLIRQKILDMAAKGAAVLIISQDLEELLEITDNFAVLNEGRLSTPRPTTKLTVEEIGLMIGNAHKKTPSPTTKEVREV